MEKETGIKHWFFYIIVVATYAVHMGKCNHENSPNPMSYLKVNGKYCICVNINTLSINGTSAWNPNMNGANEWNLNLNGTIWYPTVDGSYTCNINGAYLAWYPDGNGSSIAWHLNSSYQIPPYWQGNNTCCYCFNAIDSNTAFPDVTESTTLNTSPALNTNTPHNNHITTATTSEGTAQYPDVSTVTKSDYSTEASITPSGSLSSEMDTSTVGGTVSSASSYTDSSSSTHFTNTHFVVTAGGTSTEVAEVSTAPSTYLSNEMSTQPDESSSASPIASTELPRLDSSTLVTGSDSSTANVYTTNLVESDYSSEATISSSAYVTSDINTHLVESTTTSATTLSTSDISSSMSDRFSSTSRTARLSTGPTDYLTGGTVTSSTDLSTSQTDKMTSAPMTSTDLAAPQHSTQMTSHESSTVNGDASTKEVTQQSTGLDMVQSTSSPNEISTRLDDLTSSIGTTDSSVPDAFSSATGRVSSTEHLMESHTTVPDSTDGTSQVDLSTDMSVQDISTQMTGRGVSTASTEVSGSVTETIVVQSTSTSNEIDTTPSDGVSSSPMANTMSSTDNAVSTTPTFSTQITGHSSVVSGSESSTGQPGMTTVPSTRVSVESSTSLVNSASSSPMRSTDVSMQDTSTQMTGRGVSTASTEVSGSVTETIVVQSTSASNEIDTTPSDVVSSSPMANTMSSTDNAVSTTPTFSTQITSHSSVVSGSESSTGQPEMTMGSTDVSMQDTSTQMTDKGVSTASTGVSDSVTETIVARSTSAPNEISTSRVDITSSSLMGETSPADDAFTRSDSSSTMTETSVTEGSIPSTTVDISTTSRTAYSSSLEPTEPTEPTGPDVYPTTLTYPQATSHSDEVSTSSSDGDLSSVEPSTVPNASTQIVDSETSSLKEESSTSIPEVTSASTRVSKVSTSASSMSWTESSVPNTATEVTGKNGFSESTEHPVTAESGYSTEAVSSQSTNVVNAISSSTVDGVSSTAIEFTDSPSPDASTQVSNGIKTSQVDSASSPPVEPTTSSLSVASTGTSNQESSSANAERSFTAKSDYSVQVTSALSTSMSADIGSSTASSTLPTDNQGLTTNIDSVTSVSSPPSSGVGNTSTDSSLTPLVEASETTNDASQTDSMRSTATSYTTESSTDETTPTAAVISTDATTAATATAGTTNVATTNTATTSTAGTTTATATAPTTATTPSTTTTTTTSAGFAWTTPTAWSSNRLYDWGSAQGDVDILDATEHWTKYYKCYSVKVNGKGGTVFFHQRHYTVNICNNGLLSFDLSWRPYYPFSFGSNYWYNQWSFLAPFWGRGDELTMSLLSDDWPQARTQIYYQVYKRSFAMNSQTETTLARAKQDVASSPQGVAGFEPSWVLVVTWVNLAGDVGCRWILMYERLYSNYWWYERYYLSRYESYLVTCKLNAERNLVNHFQAVYITDGVYSFIKYNYPEDGINWAYPGIGPDDSIAVYSSARNLYGIATGGYQAPGSTGSVNHTNLWNAGSLDFIDIDNRAGNMIDSRVGEWLFRVEESKGEVEARVQCQKWVDTQNWIFYAFYNTWSHCPQNLWQGWWDPAFRTHSYRFGSHFNTWCMQSVFPHRLFGLKQRCCYDINWGSDSFSALITEFPYHGHVTNPFDPEDEEDGYVKCCVYSTDTCKEFYRVRPVNDGRWYIPPVVRPWFGDPHIITSDGFSYTFNGLGEYLFTKIGDNDTVIQARTERVVLSDGTFGQATYFSAICIATVGLPNVQVQINKSPDDDLLVNTTQLIVNGSLVDFSVIEQDANTTQSIDGISSDIQFERSNDTLTVLFSSGVSIAVTPTNGMLTITLGLPSSVKNTTIGLTGTFDDNQENDLAYLNGTGYISINSTESEIFDWASTFAISEEDSLMYYTDNTNWYTYNNNSFIPVFIDNIANWTWFNETFKTAAYDLCGDDTSCLYDVYITGDLSIGESSKKTAEDSAATSAQLNNFAPTINGPNTLLVTAGQFVYMMSVNDSNGDDVTVKTNINSTITVNGDEVTISGNITNTTNFRFVIIAKDPAGASSSKTLLTMFCDCVNNGTCVELTETEQQDLEVNSVTLDCICPTGYTGDLCDTDLDACELVASPCYPSVLCVDSPAPADHEGYTCGDCPAGYTGDGKTCNDVDECVGNVCDHICINSPGSFVCACRTGYSLNADGSTCDDIDECLTDTCHQVCNNTDGSYTCTCDPGFVLSSDNVNCEPANPCADPHPCDVTNGLCNSENGTEVCYCKKGYQLAVDGTTCEDVNECTMNTHACVQDCINTDGGYNCSCQSGYTLASNGIDCDDINECTAGGSNCLTSQICINNVGGYSCECPGSSVLVNGQCTVLLTTSPVAEIVDSPGTEAEINSVLFSLQGMTIAEYTVEKETRLFTLLANSATITCSTQTCSLVDLGSEAKRRRKRSTPSVTFYKEYFSRLPGYPQYDSNGDLELAIYSLVPGSGVLSSLLLKQVVEDVSLNISAALGVQVANIAYYHTTTSATSTESIETSTPIRSTSNMDIIIYVSIGSALVVVTVVVVLIAVCIKYKNRSKRVSHSPEPLSYTRTDEMMNEEETSGYPKTTKNTRVVLHGGRRDMRQGASQTPVDPPASSLAWE